MVALPCSSPTTVSFAASRGAIPASNGLQVSSTSITSTLLINATQPPNALLLILRCPCSRGRIDTAWLIGVQAWRSADDGSAGGVCYADPTFCAFAQWGPYAYESRLGNCQFRHEFLDQADASHICWLSEFATQSNLVQRYRYLCAMETMPSCTNSHTRLPKLSMSKHVQRRDSLSSSRTRDSGYNSDPDPLSPLEIAVVEQGTYALSVHLSEP